MIATKCKNVIVYLIMYSKVKRANASKLKWRYNLQTQQENELPLNDACDDHQREPQNQQMLVRISSARFSNDEMISSIQQWWNDWRISISFEESAGQSSRCLDPPLSREEKLHVSKVYDEVQLDVSIMPVYKFECRMSQLPSKNAQTMRSQVLLSFKVQWRKWTLILSIYKVEWRKMISILLTYKITTR